MHRYVRDYGRLGRIGLVTPQANPTAEPEIRCLLPAGVSLLTARSVSRGDPRQRFLDYFERLGETLDTFDTLQLDAVAFACTASSYLVDPETEHTRTAQLSADRGCPVVTAAAAIHEALQFLGARSIALACPYPQWLFERATDWWAGRGYRIRAAQSLQPDMGDTRAIYELSGVEAADRLAGSLGGVEADVIVITGTGMPSLHAVRHLQAVTGRPVVSSNLCLAWACLSAAGVPFNERAPEGPDRLLGGWHGELDGL